MALKSRILSKSEQNSPINNKELFTIVHSLENWQCYLKGVKHLTILMDEKLLNF